MGSFNLLSYFFFFGIFGIFLIFLNHFNQTKMEGSRKTSTEQEQNCESSSSELASASGSASALRSSTAGSASAFKGVLSSASRLNSLKDCASQTDVGINPKPSAEEQSGEEQIAKEINDEEQKNIESQIDFNENQNNNDRSRGRRGNRDRSTSERRYESQGRCQESQWRDEKGTTEEQHHTFGPRIRSRSQRRTMTTAISTMSAPPPASEEKSRLPFGRGASIERGLSPRRSDNGLVDLASFRDSEETSNSDGSAHRAGALFLPSATWTPPSLRHFGFPTEFKGFFEVSIIQFVSPWTDKIWNIVKEDSQHFPDNWNDIPATRRIAYAVTGFVSGYYLLVSLYAIPLVALGFLAPVYLCRQYLENEVGEEEEQHPINNNNKDDIGRALRSVKEMSLWMKFWVSFCGWLLASSLAPRIIAAILPLKIITLLFVVASLVAPWSSNPAVFSFDRLLLPLFHRIDKFVENSKEKFIESVLEAKRRHD